MFWVVSSYGKTIYTPRGFQMIKVKRWTYFNRSVSCIWRIWLARVFICYCVVITFGHFYFLCSMGDSVFKGLLLFRTSFRLNDIICTIDIETSFLQQWDRAIWKLSYGERIVSKLAMIYSASIYQRNWNVSVLYIMCGLTTF